MASLSGVLGLHGARISDSEGIATSLQQHWAPTSTAPHHDFDANEARSFLGQFGLKWNLESVPPPDVVDVDSVTRRAKISAPGPDGLPYIAWRMGGQKAAHSLLGLLRIACVGRCVEGMNDQLMVFQPKDTPEADEDDLNISREPADTRPLSLKNSDIKICTSAVNGKLSGSLRTVRTALRGDLLAVASPSRMSLT
jgi:hypothetical protein